MQYLIWSNEHQMWWRARECGYTEYIEEAGRYSFDHAARIVNSATVNGLLKKRRTDPVTGRQYDSQSEAMVRAPEDIPVLEHSERSESVQLAKVEAELEAARVERDWLLTEAPGELRARFFAVRAKEAAAVSFARITNGSGT